MSDHDFEIMSLNARLENNFILYALLVTMTFVYFTIDMNNEL